MPNPEIFVVAGPNGAGKSTGAAAILPKRFPTDRFLNADDIAKALATDSRIEAGKVMLRRMHKLREQRDTFAFEMTLANRWALCDNSGERLVVVARGRMGEEPTIYDPQRFDRIRHAAGQD